MEWIKCRDQLPNDKQSVIAWDGKYQFLATFEERKDKRLKKRDGEFLIHGDDFWADEIIQWYSAPDDPKEE